MRPNQSTLVFVYGTLQQDHGNHRVMAQAGGRFISQCATVERFPLVVAGLPYLYRMPGMGHNVRGELYEVRGRGVRRHLDALEGHPYFYRRHQILVSLPGGIQLTAWTYFIRSRPINKHDECKEYYECRFHY